MQKIKSFIMSILIMIFNLIYNYEIRLGTPLSGFRIIVRKYNKKVCVLHMKYLFPNDIEIVYEYEKLYRLLISNKKKFNNAFIKISTKKDTDTVSFKLVKTPGCIYNNKYYSDTHMVCIPLKKYRKQIIKLLRTVIRNQHKYRSNLLFDIAINPSINGIDLSNETTTVKIPFDIINKALPYRNDLQSKYYILSKTDSSICPYCIAPVNTIFDINQMEASDIVLTKEQIFSHIIDPLRYFKSTDYHGKLKTILAA